jgi:hypothetical protein
MLPQARVSAKAEDAGDETALMRALAATFTLATARIARG